MSTARTSTERARAHQLRLKTRLDELHAQMSEIKAQLEALVAAHWEAEGTQQGKQERQ